MSMFAEQYEKYRTAFESALRTACEDMKFTPPLLAESMRYSLLSGGKRIRPVLFFSSLEAFGLPYEEETVFAVAIECIHTYSLIHDDLPAMDNDDFRRGKPSNHKKFGEGNAILAGDALLSYAFDLLLRACGSGERHRRAAQAISYAAGVDGMVSGQSADLFYAGRPAQSDVLRFIVERKTARLLAAPVVAAALLAGKDGTAAEKFGTALGFLFQATDDILDERGDAQKMGKTLGKDQAEHKLTFVSAFGMAEAERLADEYAAEAKRILRTMDADTSFLCDLVDHVRNRDQ